MHTTRVGVLLRSEVHALGPGCPIPLHAQEPKNREDRPQFNYCSLPGDPWHHLVQAFLDEIRTGCGSSVRYTSGLVGGTLCYSIWVAFLTGKKLVLAYPNAYPAYNPG